MTVPVSNLDRLAPVTPSEADFSEYVPEPSISLAPVTPAEADFNEAEYSAQVSTLNLKPTTPTNADFE
jgi:hypothetical protein